MTLRPLFSAVAALVFCWLTGCGEKPAEENKKTEKKNSCEQLDTVFARMETAGRILADTSAGWDAAKPLLEEITEGLRINVEAKDTHCLFLNHRIHPEVERFAFVESLRRKIVRDTVPGGIFYLVRLRGIFVNDEDIQEFFSEEIAHVAYRNPHAFVAYLQNDPGQREMLLNTTRWNIFREDSLLKRYVKLPGGEPVVQYIETLKKRRQAGD